MSLKETYLANSLIPKRYLNDIPLKPSNTDVKVFNELKEIKDNILSFVNQGNNLLICSNNAGNGKTTWSIKLLKSYIEVFNKTAVNNTPALFININNFLNEKKLAIEDPVLSEKIKKIERNILSANLVIFDDIGDKSLSDYDLSNMYYWIDYRTANLKSCIYTSNQLPEQLKKSLNGKIYSRIVNYSLVKKIMDGDHRSC